jgi:O-antigen/teichoic acid export membrane protein
MPLLDRLKGLAAGLLADLRGAKRKGSFARHVALSMSDAMLSTLAQLLLTPLVARLYGPEAYGIYGLFISISTNLSLVAVLSYPNALLLPRDDEAFRVLARATLALSVVMAVLMVPFFLWHDLLFRLAPGWRVLGHWTYAIPPMVLVLAVMQLLYVWVARAKAFSLNTKLGPATNVGLRLTNLGLGLVSHGAASGLMLGELVVRTLSMLAYGMGLRRHGIGALRTGYDLQAMRTALVEHRNQPLLVFPSRWLAIFSTQVPVFALTALHDTSGLGQFAMGSGLLLMPLRLLGYSLSGVIYQKAAETQANDPAAMGAITTRLHGRLALLGVLPFTFITFFGDVVFRVLLGEAWALAGSYTAVMGLFYYFRLLSEPLVTLFSVVGKERRMFRFYAGATLLNLLAVLAAMKLFGTAASVVLAFAAVNTLLYMRLSARLLTISGAPWARPMLRAMALLCAASAVFAGLRLALVGDLFPAL